MKPRHRFAYQCLHNVKMYKYAKFDKNIPCGSRVMSVFTNRPRPAGRMPRPRFAYKWLDNVKMYKYAKFDQNIQCGSRVISIFTN